MSAVFTPARTKISFDRFQKMIAAGVLTKYDRVELIEGEMIDMAPIGSKHAAAIDELNRLLVLALSDRAIVRCQGPVVLGDFSEPQPDLALLRLRAGGYRDRLPGAEDILLIIEVSDSTQSFDRGTKLPLHAKHGVPEVWIVDVIAKCAEIYRNPSLSGYQTKVMATATESSSPSALPEIRIAWSDILG